MLIFLVLFLISSGVLYLIFYKQISEFFHRIRNGKIKEKNRIAEDILKFCLKQELDDNPCLLLSLNGLFPTKEKLTEQVLGKLLQSGDLILEKNIIHLSTSGRNKAMNILRAHRLYEVYLAENTGFDELDWHEMAEEAEHSLSPTAVEKMNHALGYPLWDPHGDPIPTATGRVAVKTLISLNQAQVGKWYRIDHLEDEPEEVYAQLRELQLYPGQEVFVKARNAVSVSFQTFQGDFSLSPLVCENIGLSSLSRETTEPDESIVSLMDIALGEPVTLVEMTPRIRGIERRRLRDLGFVPGAQVKPVLDSPGGDPRAYEIKGASIAIRRIQASEIIVKRNA